MKLKFKIYNFFRNLIFVPINFIRCKIYPFWAIIDYDTGKPFDYKFTWYDDIPMGWRKAFGKQLSKDLKKALIKSRDLYNFKFTQIKEKYGTLCLYNNGCTKEVSDIIQYYEDLSMCYCINCGKPSRWVTEGWISYLCDNCAQKIAAEGRRRIDVDDIPTWKEQINGEWVIKDLGINYKELLGLNDENNK